MTSHTDALRAALVSAINDFIAGNGHNSAAALRLTATFHTGGVIHWDFGRAEIDAALSAPPASAGGGERVDLEAFEAEIIERCAKVADDYARDGRLSKEYACETADEIAARVRRVREAG